ncbi:hypothetical protein HDIA_0324 [Hartmannibacter diazotrophicus]|uniref:Protein ImuA n=1 Tax=Hartmannibacter diazotrophicus TaxID=1482074 RepID=A0A2C9D316_9HYPH|nr:hypothetical protein [Hartmannibacter diazotrophicus]SON53865.1 hypothetical protein HDIA_0324 [Hartmannibacter diazotrophicus]
MQDTISHLRRRIAALEQAPPAFQPSPDSCHARTGREGGRPALSLGLARIDQVLGGGLRRDGLHEIFAAGSGDTGAAFGFAAALAARLTASPRDIREIVWIRQEFGALEAGDLYAPGLAALGLDPARLILVTLRDPLAALRAGIEALRCTALAGVVIELWGEPKALDLTATRRMALAAQSSAVPALLLRPGGTPAPSAAETRWQVAALPSRPAPANAPGLPAFEITLLRQRAGVAGRTWRVEWNRDRQSFRPAAPLSRPVVPVPVRRPAAAEPIPFARTG